MSWSITPHVVASQASRKVLARLPRDGGRGIVTAMFGRSLHVVFEDRFLVHIGSDDLPLTPRSLLLGPRDFARLHQARCRVGDVVTTGPSMLALASLSIRVCPPATRLFDPKFELRRAAQPLDAISKGLMATMLAMDEMLGERCCPFRNYVAVRFSAEGGRRSSVDAATRDIPGQDAIACQAGLWEGADGFRTALRRHAMQEAREAARRMIGLGPGLTPSGDDFLAGFVSAMVALARSGASGDAWGRSVGQIVREEAEGKTTRLSLAMLDDAADGDVGEAAGDFLHAAVEGADLAETCSLALKACAAGASSGEDFLNGLAAGALHATDVGMV